MGPLLIELKVTLDGLLTLLGGVLAFVVIWRQTRHSDAGLEKQLRAERVARAEEQAGRTRAVARALLFEIVNFYVHFQKFIRGQIEQVDPRSCLPPTLSAPSPDAFVVYRGNANRLGEFRQDVVEGVVKFYGLAERFLTTVRDYTAALENELQRMSSVAAESAPRRHLVQMQKLWPSMDMSALAACKKLCEVAGIPYEGIRFEDN